MIVGTAHPLVITSVLLLLISCARKISSDSGSSAPVQFRLGICRRGARRHRQLHMVVRPGSSPGGGFLKDKIRGAVMELKIEYLPIKALIGLNNKN